MNDDFFRREHQNLARDLLGRRVQVDKRSFFILGAEGFPRDANGGLYEPITGVAPGSVYCPKFHNHCLLLVACLSVGVIGGCVKIQSIELSDGTIIKKPGLSAQALGITEHGITGSMFERNGELILSLNGADPPRMEPPLKRASTGVSEDDVRARMGKIIKVYTERRKANVGLTFQTFLAECFACTSARTLGMLLNT